MAGQARQDRADFRRHAARTMSIARRRIGSPAGLAISFSLGFVSGAGRWQGDRAPAKERPAETRAGEPATGIAYGLFRGPLGETTLKLGSAVLAKSLMKYMDERNGPTAPAAPSGG